MSIATTVLTFHPAYDGGKLAALVDSVQATVSALCNLGGYAEGDDPELDSFVVRKVREAIASEQTGALKSRTIEGYSETFLDGGESFLTDLDKAFLSRKARLIRGYA